jgi:hypothetical protein
MTTTLPSADGGTSVTPPTPGRVTREDRVFA